MTKKITIGYLYPEYMNIYGDTGNLITLIHRMNQRGIETEIKEITVGSSLTPNEIDIYFFGGGQDQQQVHVSEDIQRLAEVLSGDLTNGAVALTICGGYQLFGKFYRPFSQQDLPGISIFPVETHASNVRMINNIVVQIQDTLYKEMQQIYTIEHPIPPTLVGFENHSGQTIFSGSIEKEHVIGQTLVGYGNNETRNFEGCWVHNAFGTYLHGSLLPKNPHFADYLIYKALEYRYQKATALEPLDDELEYKAHQIMVKRLLK